MLRDDIESSLGKAVLFLDEALHWLIENEQRRVDLAIFKALSELEYVTFLMSQEFGDNYIHASSRRQRTGNFDLGPNLAVAWDLVMQALQQLNDLRSCYTILSECRGILTAVQEELFKRALTTR